MDWCSFISGSNIYRGQILDIVVFDSGSYYDAVVRRVELEEIHMIEHSQHSRTNFDSDLYQGCEFSLAQIWLLSLLKSY